MKSKKLVCSIMILVFGIAAVGCGANKVSNADTLYSNYNKLSNKEKEEKVQNSSFITECNYQGEDVPYYLFDEKFQISEDITTEDGTVIDSAYVPNKVLDINDDTFEDCKKKLETHINSIFNMSYKNILKDQEAFVTNYLASLAYDGDTLQQNAYDIEELYVDHKLTTTADISTAKCLLYEDIGMYILRASIDIRIAGDEEAQEAFEKTFNIKLNDGAATVMAEAFYTKDGLYDLTVFTMTNIKEESK